MRTDEIRDCLLRPAFLSYFLARSADFKYFDKLRIGKKQLNFRKEAIEVDLSGNVVSKRADEKWPQVCTCVKYFCTF